MQEDLSNFPEVVNGVHGNAGDIEAGNEMNVGRGGPEDDSNEDYLS